MFRLSGPAAPSRRSLLRFSAGALAGLGLGAGSEAAERAAFRPVRARRPVPPYRVWFQPTLFVRDMELYANMTLDCGWLDPRLAEMTGKTALGWVYGLNHPYAKGPEYWRDACTEAGLAYPRNSQRPQWIAAGISVDEWVPPKLPDNERWLAEGLRAGRRANPEVFIALWTTDPTPALIELGRDGTLDLIIVEAYTHAAAEAGPGLTTSWEGGLRRCDALVEGGLEGKTILSFGHITARANAKGQHLKDGWIRERAEELKRRYPRMPGVAFYQHSREEDTPELRELVRACDRLSAELWPDAGRGREADPAR